MTNLAEAANLVWKVDMVSPEIADTSSGIVSWLTRIIHTIWDNLDVNWEQWVPTEGEEEDYFPTGGYCGF